MNAYRAPSARGRLPILYFGGAARGSQKMRGRRAAASPSTVDAKRIVSMESLLGCNNAVETTSVGRRKVAGLMTGRRKPQGKRKARFRAFPFATYKFVLVALIAVPPTWRGVNRSA